MTSVAVDNSVLAAPYLERGIQFLRQNNFALAVSDFDNVLMFDPNNKYAHYNRGMALLALGNYPEGFREHDWVYQIFHWRGFGPVQNDIDRVVKLPLWNGIEHKRALIYHELGWGDAIQVCRYLPELQRRGDITLVIDQLLARLMKNQFGVDVVVAVPTDLTEFDCRLPLFGAMSVLHQTVATIPNAPYIDANWRRTGGKIGIGWAGRTQNMFTAEAFVSMLGLGDEYELFALNPGQPSPGMHELVVRDFADTVKTIEQMDHVITVDTAVAHLAGAMGHPSTHVVLPFSGDWRWWHVSAWYPTVKTYRQPQPGVDWTLPFAQVREAISHEAKE